MTLLSRLFLLKKVVLLPLFGLNFGLSFITLKFIYPEINLNSHFYFSCSVIVIWTVYIGMSGYQYTHKKFIASLREQKFLRRITLQNMQIESLNVKLGHTSHIDALSNLYNRRYFDRKLNDEIRRTQRANTELGLLIVDIDHFKQINDCMGHDVGDKYIKLVATTLQSCVKRPEDIVARYGGDEFAFILPNTHMLGLKTVAMKINQKVRDLELAHPSADRLTVSIGGALLSSANNCQASLFKAADNNLYKVKRTTRNSFNIS
ncbi:GGDEF domain-containing protein [Vibrio splendidus]|uniref:GGDEF domain-containing protein n=1 Tax=Vibrio splendidus TaxID=29497 RepID=UPI00076A2827|nr:GGDEF domain-containing protein [Vibrio splendidus]